MMRLMWRWLLSKSVREATMMYRYARRLAREQRDLVGGDAMMAVLQASTEVRGAIIAGENGEALRTRLAALEQCVQKHLRAFPNAAWRENILEFAGTATKILAVFCFFIQPMAIPSGSAQPTLYGITSQNLKGNPQFQVPALPRRVFDSFFRGVHIYHVVAKTDGELRRVEPVRTLFPLIKRQRFLIGDRWHSVWFPTDNLADRARLMPGESFRAGEDVLKLRVVSGDHLFVNRMIYNFRRPQRGETIVFHTHDIDRHLRNYRGPLPTILVPNTHYIKRLVALGGEKVRIGDDRHVVINGRRLDASTPGFESVYTFQGPPRESVYSGHVNDAVARSMGRPAGLAEFFPDGNAEFEVRPNHYLVFGDNTMNSYDGRGWGDFPREHVVGRASFVFWPISSRFGWGYR